MKYRSEKNSHRDTKLFFNYIRKKLSGMENRA